MVCNAHGLLIESAWKRMLLKVLALKLLAKQMKKFIRLNAL